MIHRNYHCESCSEKHAETRLKVGVVGNGSKALAYSKRFNNYPQKCQEDS